MNPRVAPRSAAGLGLDLQIARNFSLGARVGRQLKGIPSNNGERETHGHLNLAFSF